MRKLFCVMIVLCVILFLPINARAAAIPYMPPTDVSLFDTLYNVYGLTSPNITNVTDRLNAYLDIYKKVLGGSYEEFEQNITDTFTKAKTQGYIEIDSGLSESLQAGMYEALQSGFEVGEPQAGKFTPAAWQEVLSNIGVTVSMDKLTNLYKDASHNGRDTVALAYLYSSNYLILGCYVYGGDSGYVDIHISSWGEYGSFEGKLANGKTANPAGGQRWIYRVVNGLATERVEASFGGMIWGSPYPMSGVTGNTEPIAGEYLKSQAVNEEVAIKISQLALDIVTPYTKILNGVIDDTKPIKITLPVIDVVPATTIDNIPQVWEDTQAKPLVDGETVETQVQDMLQTMQDTYGGALDYRIDLTEYFPFCIPFDIVRFVQIFDAEPIAPHFEYSFPIGYEQGQLQYYTANINLDWFSPFMAVWRKIEFIFAVLGVMFLTRQLIRG